MSTRHFVVAAIDDDDLRERVRTELEDEHDCFVTMASDGQALLSALDRGDVGRPDLLVWRSSVMNDATANSLMRLHDRRVHVIVMACREELACEQAQHMLGRSWRYGHVGVVRPDDSFGFTQLVSELGSRPFA
jgi:hypothetical protein